MSLIKTAQHPGDYFYRGGTVNRGYVFSGLCREMPTNGILIINFALYHIMDGFTKKEDVIKGISEAVRSLKSGGEDVFIDFDNPRTKFRGKNHRESYRDTFETDADSKKVLEAAGYFYPRNVRECIDLFIQMGIMFEYVKDGTIHVDMILEPFPSVDVLLKAKKDE